MMRERLTFLHDLRYAWRGLCRQPSFTMIALVTLALGIGVNTAVFSVFYAVLMRPLPYRDPGRVVVIWANFKTRGTAQVSVSGEIFREIEQRQRSMAAVSGIWVTPPRTFSGDPPVQVKSAFVTTNFFDVLGVGAAMGRTFARADGGGPFLIFADAFWRRRFGADAGLIGKGLDGSDTLVGVLPADFQLHFAPEANVPGDVQVFQAWGPDFYSERNYIVRLVARLAPDMTMDGAQQDFDRVAKEIRAESTEFAREDLHFRVTGMQADAFRDVRPGLTALFAGGAFVLLICCVNVTGLLLARGSDRRREIAVRLAIGASRGRIVSQLLAEAAVLGAAGGLAGAAAGWAVFRGLLAIRPERLARIEEPHLLWSLMAYTALASFAATFLVAVIPAIQGVRVSYMEAIRARGQGWSSRTQRSVGRVLVIGEIALGFVLVTGAVLAARTLFNVEQVRPGFEPRNTLAFQLPGMPPAQLTEWETRFAAIAGVEAAGAISHLPFDTTLPNWFGEYRVRFGARVESDTADSRAVTPGYLPAMGARLLEGRHFSPQDHADAPNVVIVDEMLARSTWPGESALGKRIDAQHMTRRGTPFEFVDSVVVGVVEHVHSHSLIREVRPQVYSPFAQNFRDYFPQTFVLRTSVPPDSLVPAVRTALRQRNPQLAMDKVQPMTAYVDREIAPTGFVAVLAAIFGGLALLLAATGIYGMLNYQVSRRMPEMGTRMAVGATAGDVLALVLREGLVLAAAGIVLGLVVARGAAQGFGSLLFGVSASDPVSFGVALLLLPSAALLGCWRPARRAAGANPAELIRAE
jgi:putative ABC transport system permease protein